MRLYIGNIQENINESEIKELLGKFKSLISVKIITDKNNGISKGFGFVEFKDTKDGENAIEKFNGYEMKGKALEIKVADVKGKRLKKSNGTF